MTAFVIASSQFAAKPRTQPKCVVVGSGMTRTERALKKNAGETLSAVLPVELTVTEKELNEETTTTTITTNRNFRERITSKGIVIFADFLSDLIVLDIVDRIETEVDIAFVLLGTFVAYLLADLSSGLYYWLTHNYGSSRTLLWGREIERTRQIVAQYSQRSSRPGSSPPTKARDFFTNVVNHCLVAIPFLTMLAGWHPESLAVESFCVMFISVLAVLPQVDMWSRMESPPVPILILQKTRLLGANRTKSHSTTNELDSWSPPVDGYCVGNVWNRFLDQEGVFRHLEKMLYIASDGKLVPRAWETLGRRRRDELPDTYTKM